MDLITLSDVRMGPEIGQGACSSVHACTLPGSAGVFAVKVIKKSDIRGTQHLARLYREKDILAACKHPGVVRFHRTFQDDERLILLLDLVRGGTLLWHMRQSPQKCLAVRDARTCVAQLLVILRDLHRDRVLYRDIKPTNIMFDEEGRMRLVDFGHAKRVHGEERSHSAVGTPHYMAPEMVLGAGHGLPAQLWAVGVLLVEVIVGTPPFVGATEEELFERILEEGPNEALLRSCGAGGAVADAARKLLAKDPDTRLRHFPGAFASVLEHPAFADVDVAAIEAGKVPQTELDFSRHVTLLDDMIGPLSRGSDRSGAHTDADPFADF